MGEVFGVTDRTVRNWKKAGKLDWIEQLPTGYGGRPLDEIVVQSGTAFGPQHAEEVKEKHIAALGDHARAGIPKKAITKKRNPSKADAPPGGGTSATDITEITKK